MQAQNLIIRFSSKCQGRNVCWCGFVVVCLIKLFDRQSINHCFKDKHFQILKVGMRKKSSSLLCIYQSEMDSRVKQEKRGAGFAFNSI